MSRAFTGSQIITAAAPIRNTTPISMACWFNPSTDTARLGMICVGHSTTPTAAIYLELRGDVSGHPVRFTVYNDTSAPTAGGGTFVANQWQHACGVAANTQSRNVYLNGTSVGTETITNTPDPTAADNFTIGSLDGSGTPSLYFQGSLAEIAIWGAALTDAEVAALAKGFRAAHVRPQSLLFYAPLVRSILDARGAIALTDSGTTAAVHPRIYS